MKDGRFTPQAALLWSAIPHSAKERILANVFCGKCGGSVQITNFSGEERAGDLDLKGVCAKCGNKVVRLVETSETDKSRN